MGVSPRARAVLLATLSVLLGCDGGNEPQPARVVPRPSPVPDLRVVSLSREASEFVVALGAGGLVVGIDEESGGVAPLAGLPIVGPAQAAALDPDVVIAPPPLPEAAMRGDADWVAFDPHDLEDVLALCRSLGARLVGSSRAMAFETELSRPLARLAGEAFGRPRARVLAVVGIDPPVIAGGHSFETDLIEIAGAQSVTHGGDEPRLDLPPERWTSLDPDLVLFVSRGALEPSQRAAVREQLSGPWPVAFFAFDRTRFWLRDPAADVQRLRDLLAARLADPSAALPSSSVR